LQAVFVVVRDCLKSAAFILNAALKPGDTAV
jgi:hypothetical protein